MIGNPRFRITFGPEGIAVKHHEGENVVVEFRYVTAHGAQWTRFAVMPDTWTVLKSGLLDLPATHQEETT